MLSSFPILVFALLAAALAAVADARETLVTCSAVRSMPAEEASKFWTVDLQGVLVSRMDGPRQSFVMQDETGCIFVELPEQMKGKAISLSDLKPGMGLTVKGYTIYGDHGPRVKISELIKSKEIGLPPPVMVEAGEFADGKYEDRYVEFNAVVRLCRTERTADGQVLVVSFGPGDRRIEVQAWLPDGMPVPRIKTDDLVRVRGVVLTRKNTGHLSTETVMIVDGEKGLELLFDASEKLSTIPEIPVSVLLAQPHDAFLERRRKVSGVVTLFWPGRLTVIQNELSAVRIVPPPGLELKTGDRVTVAGIPTPYEDGVLMEQAIFSTPESSPSPVPEPVLRGEVTSDSLLIDRDGQFLALGGVVAAIGQKERDHVVTIESDHGIFRCLLPNSGKLPDGVAAGAYVEVTGVCRLLYGWEMGKRSKDFELLLPDASSINVRTVPSWWTPGRVGTVFLLSSVAVAALGAWGISLRRKVRVRTDLLARVMNSRRETELISGERSRLAMELHDGISQVLTAAAFQLEAAAKNRITEERKEEKLHLVKRLLEQGREDLRRAVWDLAPGSLDKLGFKGALDNLADEIAAKGHLRVEVSASGPVNEIPPRVRSHLFRLIQEAVSNAAAHSGAATIRAEVDAGEEWISATVRDDGKGFDPLTAPGPEKGHLGLHSMKTRVAVLKGTMNLESSPEGTSIHARIPVDSIDHESLDEAP